MNTISLPNPSHSKSLAPVASSHTGAFRIPHFDTQPQDDALEIKVYLPGVESSGIEISTCGTDLTVTARKRHPVRSNWRSFHLEPALHDYQLSLRLGRSLDFDNLRARLDNGVLTIALPYQKQSPISPGESTVQGHAA